MRERFKALWKNIGASGNAEEKFDELSSLYSQSQRTYHNLNHVRNCLLELDSVKGLVYQYPVVEFAIWYHDVINEPLSKENEEKSALFAYQTCLCSKLSSSFSLAVKDYILYTKHIEIPQSLDAKLMLDIDLSILGKPKDRFKEFEKQIRIEYAFVSGEDYKKGRIEFFQRMLGRPHIYLTDVFKDKYEQQARKNLKKGINRLKANL